MVALCIDCHERPIVARGRCKRCYRIAAERGAIQVQHRSGATRCCVQGCAVVGVLTRGLCHMHYVRWQRTGSTDDPWPTHCAVKGCPRGGQYRRGLCNAHYMQWWREQRETIICKP